jgi:hypothetical protein
MPEKARAYAWVAYMISREPEEFYKLLKYGTPSNELIKLTQRRVFMHVDKDDIRRVTFPLSPNKAAGQKLLYQATQDIVEFNKRIPLGAYNSFLEAKQLVKARRADTTANIHMVAEAIFSRVATEFKVEVLFSFDSINAWINAKYGKTLNYITIRKALELLDSKFIITVREWGQRGVRDKATKIYVHLDSEWRNGELSDCDEWILATSSAMNAVYARESTARQDVLAARFQHYLENYADKPEVAREWPQSKVASSTPQDDIIAPEAEKVSVAVVARKQEHEEIDIDRLLGGVVQPVQAYESDTGFDMFEIFEELGIH